MTQETTPSVTNKSLDGVICVTLEVHLWSGRKRLKKEDLIAKNSAFAELPPETLASLGSIKVCDPDDLAPFLAAKRAAEKLISTYGLPCFGTMGIPEAKLQTVFTGLQKIQEEFNELKQGFYDRYERSIDLWRNQESNSQWSGLLRDIPTPDEVAGKLSFGFHLARTVAPSADDEFSEINKLYATQMTGLKGELFVDASREAKVLITKYLTAANLQGVVQKREKVTWKTIRPLKRIAEKFRSFAALDPTCEPLAKMIEHVLGQLPTSQEGPIEGVDLMNVWALAQALISPKRAMNVAEVAFTSQSSADAFDHLCFTDPSYQPVTPAVTETSADTSAHTSSTEPALALDSDVEVESNDSEHEAPAEQDAPYALQQEQPVYVGLF